MRAKLFLRCLKLVNFFHKILKISSRNTSLRIYQTSSIFHSCRCLYWWTTKFSDIWDKYEERNDKIIFFYLFLKFTNFSFSFCRFKTKMPQRVCLLFFRIKFSHPNWQRFKNYEKCFCHFNLLYFSSFFANFYKFKGIVTRAGLCKCDILLSSRILWHTRITPLKEWRFWCLVLTSNFPP